MRPDRRAMPLGVRLNEGLGITRRRLPHVVWQPAPLTTTYGATYKTPGNLEEFGEIRRAEKTVARPATIKM